MGLFNITSSSLVDSAAAARDIGKERLGSLAAGAAIALSPMIGEVSKTAEEKLGPFVVEGSKYGKEKVLPAVSDAASYAKEKLVPLMGGASKYGKERVFPAVGEVARISQGKAGSAIARAGEVLTKNPEATALVIASGLVFLFPGMISVPALWLFGLGKAGPRAGSAASAYQSRNGNIARRSGFATLQSAAGGGYGWPVVRWAVRWFVRAGLAIMVINGAPVFLEWLPRMVHGIS